MTPPNREELDVLKAAVDLVVLWDPDPARPSTPFLSGKHI
jgi:hypothetical protein